MARTRELYMDINVAGRNFIYEHEILKLIGDEAEIMTAYFAEKVIEFEEETHEEYYSFTFKDNDNILDSAAKKTKLANYIRRKLDMDGDTKYTTNQKILESFTKDSYKKDDEITITALRKEKKEYYKKISGAPMGYQVYLVAETKNLDGKKVSFKIQETKSIDQDNRQVLKLVKNEDDVLPVLVFADVKDKTTDTEITDCIEIEINKEDSKILNRTEGEEIELGIKKIQLRPKKDKMSSKTEDAIKSFEGWQEALYIRKDETEEGKKEKQEAEDAKKARDAEAFITLTRDPEADKKENKKSYPKKLSGPKSADIGKEVVYTIETYNATATEADKKNIQWSLYNQDTPKTSYTIIDKKSKSNLYTYAKMEIVGNKNKLTIVFNDALKGKKVQIEPFRSKPDIENKHDYVRTTTIVDKATAKIVKRDTARLWLQTQCDSIETAGKKLDFEFLKGSGFKLETPNTIHIFEDGKISKLNLEGLDKVKYRYHDANGDKFNICECDISIIKKKATGQKVSSFRVEKPTNIIDYESKNITGVSAKTSKVYADGTVITEGRKYGQNNYKIIYKCLDEDIKLVHMKKLNRLNKPVMRYKFYRTLREYSNPFYFGAFIGALAELTFEVSCGGSCYEDGSSFPSLEHNNGFAIDTGYKYKKESDEKLIKAMKKFGFTKRIKGSTTYLDTLSGHSKRDKGNLHDTHLHFGKLVINEI